MEEKEILAPLDGGGVSASPRASENISSPYVWIVDGPAKFEGSFELKYNTVINVGHTSRYYGVVAGYSDEWIGSFDYNVYNIRQFFCRRDRDWSSYDTHIYFSSTQYSGKTLKVYGQNGNLLWTFTISGDHAYVGRRTANDPLGIRPEGGKRYYNLVIE